MVRTVADVPSYELASVDSQDNLVSAIEIMFENDYSQLGVERDGELIGMVSYRSISRVLSILRKLGADKNLPGRTVQIAIEDVEPVVEPSEDLVVLFDLLAEDPYVLVDDPDQESLQILTNYDLLHYLRDSIEPFLMIEDIEIAIRTLLQEAFPDDLDTELQNFYQDKDTRTPEGLTDCSFGHYPQFMCQNWPQFESYFEENGDFVRRLINEVGVIRNQIFHFRTNAIIRMLIRRSWILLTAISQTEYLETRRYNLSLLRINGRSRATRRSRERSERDVSELCSPEGGSGEWAVTQSS